MTELEKLNFFTDPSLVGDPSPYYDAMRESCPVKREPHHNVMMVTGYEEAIQVLNDEETFSSCISVTGPYSGFPLPTDSDDITDLIEETRPKLPMNDQLPTMDPPQHTDHRALLMRLITPKRLKENEEFIWRLADKLLDDLLAKGSGEVISEFAAPFAMLVIADLLGVPESDHQEFIEGLNLVMKDGISIGSTEGTELKLNPMEFLYQKFGAYIEDRRANPRDDVLTGLATATFPDGTLPPVDDVLRIAANVFSAGQETTVRLVSSGLRIIAEDPELQQTLREDPERINNFIEETLRMESPIKGDFRLSKVPAEVGGVEVPAGTIMMLVNGAANRDPRQFTDPAEFDLDRRNARTHIAFGRGIHACPGAPLARTEARVGFERLLERTSNITISEKVHGPEGDRKFDYLPTFILRGLLTLNLDFTLPEADAK
ncbi:MULTISPECIES: cytochrome P450 [unclassified Rhodococcus (in: high G+C Gram-positive bacteria)]|uniref:cytochrome P450 n=1 Tax=unclassified Rhodococcus (in: high G+C Gram-positive bacteria) TaxID=192944 RepID=UPI00146B06AD|nr:MULTISPECIES: cytochrome P450 [unclassified Rhodococcus (in: high G+C Gram-positive bacteria)]NMD96712.1 cytochrome P450 [Rhodococcus sp. BL-253-APC-6A1W]NME78147.1 cytochrome P450 [Rhodococcus sp. 105337]